MRGYETGFFKDRSFLLAVTLSLLWHSFWFFSITVTVSPHKSPKKVHPRIVSLGSVLDDTIFRTLVENKPQLSQTFYRHLSDFSAKLDVQTKTIERHSPGDVVALPFGKRYMSFLKEMTGGDKFSPDFDFAARIKMRYGGAAAADRQDCLKSGSKYPGLFCPE